MSNGQSLQQQAYQAAVSHGIDPTMFVGLIGHESGWNPNAYNASSGAAGLGQMLPSTAAAFGVTGAQLRADPALALDKSAQMLAGLSQQFGGNQQQAFAAYFIGGGNVQAAVNSGGSNWLAAADQRAQQYGQGSVSQYLSSIGGGSSGGSAPVSFTPQAQIAPYQSDQQRYDFLTQQQAAGGRLGPDALAFLNSYGGGNGVQPPSNPGLVAPGSQYQTDQQRYDYLQNLVGRGVAISPDAQNFLNTYQGQTASQSNASALGEVLPQLQNDIPPAPAPATPIDPYGYQPSSGVYGNQTTTNNMTAQNAYQDVLGYQQQATAPQSGGGVTGYDPSSGAYQATVYSDSGVGTNIGGYAGDPNNAPGGSDPGIEANFAGGGTVTVGSSGRAKIAPTLAIGAPFNPETIGTFPALGKGGNLDAPEPVIFVGKYTGIPYAEAGEVPGERENVTVTPIDGPDRNDNPVGPAPVPMPTGINPVGDSMNQGTGATVTQDGMGGLMPVERKYAGGGSATVGDPNQPPSPTNPGEIQGPPAPASPVFSQYGDPNALKLQDQQNLLNSRLASIGPSQNYLNAQGNVYQSQANNFPNQQNYLGALGNVYQAQQGTFGPQQNYIDAQGNVINARDQQTQGQRAYIGQAQGANQQTQAEEAAYQAAERNLPDLTATGAAKNYQDSTDYQYRLAGVAPPSDVDTRGAALPAGSPVNVRAKIQSQADILKANNTDTQRMRDLQLQGAKLAVDLLGTNVQAAQDAAARVGLTVDQAKLLVSQAQNQASIADLGVRHGDLSTSQAQNAANVAGLGVRQADLNTEQLGYQNSLAELPPQAGLTVYTNPFTGASEYMTPAQARVQQQADNIAIGNQGGANGQSFSRSTIQSLVNKGLITDDDAFAQLTEMGYTPTQAQQLISAAKKTSRTAAGSKVPSVQKINDDIFGGQSLDPFGLGATGTQKTGSGSGLTFAAP